MPAAAPRNALGRLFSADDFDFAARTALGHAAQGTSDIGRVLSTLAEIIDGDPISWYTCWHEAAEDHSNQAAAARAHGHLDTAAWFYLAASEAYDQSLAFIDGMPDDIILLPTFRQHRQAWDAFVDCSQGRHLRISVPYQGDSMPGYLLRPSDDGAARPTVVVTNGSDGALSGLWATVAKDALARRWNVFVFDGPGQQSMLFERDVPFRHDWEAVLTPVVDTLIPRGDIDPTALFGYAISQGGYWLARALAFEHRLAACVLDSGVFDVAASWFAHLPNQLQVAYRAGDGALFDSYFRSGFRDPAAARNFAFRARPYGLSSPFALFSEVAKYRLDDVVGAITTPVMVWDNESEQFFPGQPHRLYDALSCDKAYLHFTSADGASGHCEPMARALAGKRMCDYFADHLPSTAGGSDTSSARI